MKVLIACEESQTVTLAFRKLGHEAFSCDLKPCSGGYPEYHHEKNVFEVLRQTSFDLLIAHPPCTFLATCGATWLYHPEDRALPRENRRPHPKHPNRRQLQKDAVDFVKELWAANVERIAIENPVGMLSSLFQKPTQIIQPWQFGHEASKTTCLWLKNLPSLKPTKIVGRGEYLTFASGKRMPKWYADIWVKAKTAEERRTLRSKTFDGIAQAMAEQWGR